MPQQPDHYPFANTGIECPPSKFTTGQAVGLLWFAITTTQYTPCHGGPFRYSRNVRFAMPTLFRSLPPYPLPHFHKQDTCGSIRTFRIHRTQSKALSNSSAQAASFIVQTRRSANLSTRVVPRNDRRGVTNQQTPRSIRHGFYSSIDGCNAL